MIVGQNGSLVHFIIVPLQKSSETFTATAKNTTTRHAKICENSL